MSGTWGLVALVVSAMLGTWCLLCCCLRRAVQPRPHPATSFQYHPVNPTSPRPDPVPSVVVTSPPRDLELPTIVATEPTRAPQPGLHFISNNGAPLHA